ncbi:MAG: Bug family tripartite tricarboxylate transporter substrate binding protein [Xanthobacteraceae bacterium]
MIARRTLLTAVALSCLAAGAAQAQPYPNKPVRLILPYTAGSPNDAVARLFAPFLSNQLGQPVVIDNRPGGGTTVGVNAVMQAPPDGYTLLFSNSPSHLIAPLINDTFVHDPLKDFVPIALVGASSNVLVIPGDFPAKTVQEFVAYAKANPGKLNFGFGQGTQPQLVGEMFKMAADIDLLNVPYKGGMQAVTDMMGGRIHLNIGAAGTLVPLHEAGKIRMIGYTGTKRNPQLPDIPTMIEAGYPSVVSTTYYGLLGRHDLPAEIVNRLNAATAEALKDPQLQAGLAKIRFAPVTMSSAEMAALFATESARWAPVVKATGFGK